MNSFLRQYVQNYLYELGGVGVVNRLVPVGTLSPFVNELLRADTEKCRTSRNPLTKHHDKRPTN